MRALRLHPPGRVGDLRLDQVEPPQPQPGQALVRVHAAAITRDELTWPTDRLLRDLLGGLEPPQEAGRPRVAPQQTHDPDG